MDTEENHSIISNNKNNNQFAFVEKFESDDDFETSSKSDNAEMKN